MRSPIFPTIPLDTQKAAQQAGRKSNAYRIIGDHVDDLFEDIFFQNSTTQIQDYRLAIFYLSTIFQHFESLPDPLVIDALRERWDWKYALHASQRPIPMDAALLCEFRRLVSGDPGIKQNFQTLLDRLVKIPGLDFRDSIPADADQVIHHVCTISRIAKTWEAFNNALQALAIRSPEWLRNHSRPYWYERYGKSRKDLNWGANLPELKAIAQATGSDGFYLLDAIAGSGIKDLAEIPEVRALRKIWAGQFERGPENIMWRIESCAGCLRAGYPPAATWDGKQSLNWRI